MAPRRSQKEEARLIPAAIRKLVLEEAEACYYCGADGPFVVDHLLPVDQGGTRDLDNLVPACLRCNSEKSSRTPSEWRDWRIRRGMPWPPPDTDWAITEPVVALTLAQKEQMYRAARAKDVRIWHEIDNIKDRMWAGRDNSPQEDARRLAAELVGLDLRLASARQHALDLMREELDRFDEAQRNIKVISDFDTAKDTVHRHLAEQMSDMADRFFSDFECDLLRELLADQSTWYARRTRVINEGWHHIKCATKYPDSYLSLLQMTQIRLAHHVSEFAEVCTDEQVEQLRHLVGVR